MRGHPTTKCSLLGWRLKVIGTSSTIRWHVQIMCIEFDIDNHFFFIFSHSPLNFTLAPFKKSYLPLQSISPSHVIHVFFIIIFILKEPWNYKYFSISSFLIFNLSDLIIVLFITVFNFSMSYKSTIWSSFFYCCLFFLCKFLKFTFFHDFTIQN